MIIAIDFDGTVTNAKFADFPNIGKLQPNARKIINYLHDNLGVKIIVWTCRSLKPDLDAMREFLNDNGIKFDAVNVNHFVPFVQVPKIYADVYIDDRQCGGIPEDWNDIYELLRPQLIKDIGKTHIILSPGDIKEKASQTKKSTEFALSTN
jgi:hypothetical protein